jgi:hypothetical protein
MLNDSDTPPRNPPDPDRVYRRHLERCRRLGIEPVPRDRAHDLIAEWNDTIAAGWTVAQIKQ